MVLLTLGLWVAGTALWAVAAGPSTLDRWQHPEPVVITGAALAAGERPGQIMVRLEGVRLDVASARHVKATSSRHSHLRVWETVAVEPTTGAPVAVVRSQNTLSIGVPDGLEGEWSEVGDELPVLSLGMSDGRFAALFRLAMGLLCWLPAALAGWLTWGMWRTATKRDHPARA